MDGELSKARSECGGEGRAWRVRGCQRVPDAKPASEPASPLATKDRARRQPGPDVQLHQAHDVTNCTYPSPANSLLPNTFYVHLA